MFNDADIIAGCNGIIANTMKLYSTDLKQYETPSAEQCAAASYHISNTLLHDVILMEARAFALKFCAKK